MRLSVSCLILTLIFSAWAWSDDTLSTPLGNAAENSLSDSLLEEDYQLHGIARPKLEVILTAPLQSVLGEVLVEPGQIVKKGELLASMDDRVALAAVNAAAASADRHSALQHAQLELELAEILLQRLTSVGEVSIGSAYEIDEARVRRDQALSGFNSAKEVELQEKRNWDLEIVKLETHRIRAPFDGQVLRVPGVPGGTYASTDPLINIVNLDLLSADLNVPDSLYGLLRAGTVYRLLAGPPVNEVVLAKLHFVEPIIDVASRSFRCHFEIENYDHHLPAGFTVRLDLKQASIAIQTKDARPSVLTASKTSSK